MANWQLLLWATFLLGCKGAPQVPSQPLSIDCAPDHKTPSQQLCAQRGCVYNSQQSPACQLDLTYSQARVEQITSETKYVLNASKPAPFGGDFVTPTVMVKPMNNKVLRVVLFDSGSPRFEVPYPPTFTDLDASEPDYEVNVTSQPFSFRVTRKSQGTILFDTGVGGLVLSDQFLQIVTSLPSDRVFGFGENYRTSFRHNLNDDYTWPMFNRDQPPGGRENTYGTQPFYVVSEDAAGHAHGVLILNSNAQEYSFSPAPSLTYRSIGGILDMFFFMGDSMEEVVQHYTQAIGLPVMPPYWGMGFQMSRYGFRSTYDVQKMVDGMVKYKIPFDAQYIDIDHFKNEADFTVDELRFPGLNDYFLDLRTKGLNIVYLLDPCLITNMSSYQPYEDFKRLGANIKWPTDPTVIPPPGSEDDDHNMLGWVWPDGKVIFPDFMQDKAGQLWSDTIVRHRDTLVFDGLWIDMNEPANFGTNEERAFNWPESDKPYWTLKCPNNTLEDPPYRPAAVRHYDSPDRQARLSDKTLCMSGTQGDFGVYRHYDVHSLYGRAQAVSTQQAVRKGTGNRGLVLTRSNFPGSGKYAGTWSGDVSATWEQLRASIVVMLEYNLFGMPYIGADICGFFGDPSAELCLRWHQLGAFYPFSRNHNSIDGLNQDAASYGPDVANAVREILEVRYWLIPYMYTRFFWVNTVGGTVVRAMVHEFPGDSATYDINDQFLWGSDLLISPILYEGQNKIDYYLPAGAWYDFFTGEKLNGGKMHSRPVTEFSMPEISVRGGSVIPMQRPANNTRQSRKNPFRLVVAMSDGQTSNGSLFWDDGLGIDTYENKNYYMARYHAANDVLSLIPEHLPKVNDVISGLFYDSLDILGLTSQPGPVLIMAGGVRVTGFVQEWNSNVKVLTIRNATIPLDVEVTITWKLPSGQELSRVDCWPERFGGHDDPDPAKCAQRHCVWNNATTHPDVPPCYFPVTDAGYMMPNTDLIKEGDNVYKTVLYRKGEGPFGNDLQMIEFRVEEHGENVLRFSFDAINGSRFRPPVPLTLPSNSPNDNRKYSVQVDTKNPFAFSVYRTLPNGKQGDKIWSTVAASLVFDDQFLQISTQPPTNYVYGLGENTKRTFRRDFNYQSYPIFSRDQMVGSIDTLTRNLNHYGTQPFYTGFESDNNAHGVLFFNVDPQDYTLSPLPMITYRTIGGILDFYLFLGPTPEDVLQQYHQVIGKPIMPPYWGLGFALCKYGYNSLANMKAAVDRTRDANIPLDILYGDIDHFDERRDFTYDQVAYKGLPDYFREIREQGMKTVIILDPAIVSNYTGYEPYDRLSAVDGNVHWPPEVTAPADSRDKDNAILGWVWPSGKTVYPDFFNNKTVQVWADLIVEYRDTLPFDALWIDMNEPTAFGTNEERPFNWPEDVKPYWSLKCPVSRYDDPPYRTGGSFMYDTPSRRGRLSDKTICMCAVQGNNQELRHYDVHGLYGHTQALATKVGLEKALVDQRGFIVTRSTFVGTGTTATHWLGDNASEWPDMGFSIVGLLDFNLFGFPFTGPDICGHFGSASPELCKRWMQLGAFYGFSRNHNAVGNRDQDPGSYGELVQRVSRQAMETRYRLLPYLYTLYHFAHIHGGSVLRPLHHVFPADIPSRSVDKQFMWGSGLLISPILVKEENAVSSQFYLPGPARWYDLYTNTIVSDQGSVWRTVAIGPETPIPLHVQGGTVLPTQRPALNTTYSRLNPMSVIFALDSAGQAEGSLFWDDGSSRDTYQNGAYHMVVYKAQGLKVSGSVNHTTTSSINLFDPMHLLYEHFDIWGVMSQVKEVTLAVDGGKATPVPFEFNSKTKVLRVMPYRLALKSNFVIDWSTKSPAAPIDRVDKDPPNSAYIHRPFTALLFLLCVFVKVFVARV